LPGGGRRPPRRSSTPRRRAPTAPPPPSAPPRTRQFVTRFLSRLGVESTLVQPGDEGALKEALRPGRTKVILAESPTNPYLRVADLSIFVRARDACPGANLIIDGTFATPVNQRPLAL